MLNFIVLLYFETFSAVYSIWIYIGSYEKMGGELTCESSWRSRGCIVSRHKEANSF